MGVELAWTVALLRQDLWVGMVLWDLTTGTGLVQAFSEGSNRAFPLFLEDGIIAKDLNRGVSPTGKTAEGSLIGAFFPDGWKASGWRIISGGIDL